MLIERWTYDGQRRWSKIVEKQIKNGWLQPSQEKVEFMIIKFQRTCLCTFPKTIQSFKNIWTTFHNDFHSANVDHLPNQAECHRHHLEVSVNVVHDLADQLRFDKQVKHWFVPYNSLIVENLSSWQLLLLVHLLQVHVFEDHSGGCYQNRHQRRRHPHYHHFLPNCYSHHHHYRRL